MRTGGSLEPQRVARAPPPREARKFRGKGTLQGGVRPQTIDAAFVPVSKAGSHRFKRQGSGGNSSRSSPVRELVSRRDRKFTPPGFAPLLMRRFSTTSTRSSALPSSAFSCQREKSRGSRIRLAPGWGKGARAGTGRSLGAAVTAVRAAQVTTPPKAKRQLVASERSSAGISHSHLKARSSRPPPMRYTRVEINPAGR